MVSILRMALESMSEPYTFIADNSFRDRVFELRKKYFDENEIHYEVDKARLALDSHFDCPNMNSVLLELDGKIIGEALCDKMIDFTEIVAFAILSDYQGRGFGKKLMKDTLEIIKENKSGLVFLRVRKDNEKAIKFYESCGFELGNNHTSTHYEYVKHF